MNTKGVIRLIASIREAANQLLVNELESRGIKGLAPSHGSILAALYQNGPLAMGQLAGRIGRKKNTVTTLINKLEALGYIRREKDQADSRVTMIHLTEAGQAFRPDFDEISKVLIRKTWGETPKNRQEDLVRELERMLANLS